MEDKKLIKIQAVGSFKIIEAAYLVDGKLWRDSFTPDMDISEEDKEVQDLANANWTDELKLLWKEKCENDNKLEKDS
tara:strand:- start:1021 stop:1251 length:231 start_codon:yes stop_codon:yes gene_type:complete